MTPPLQDVALIGAGPIGIEMATVLTRAGISYVHLEAGQVGEMMLRWPRETRFFSAPEWVSIAGVPIHSTDQSRPTGDEYLAYLRGVVEQFDLEIRTFERVTRISGAAGDFHLESLTRDGGRHTYRARNVILATGDINEPRRLGIPGEDLPHVGHLWDNPHRWFRRRLLIVGGRNSAAEAAIRAWRAGARVALSYRGPALEKSFLLSSLHLMLDLLIKNGKVEFYPLTTPVEITATEVHLRGLAAAECGALNAEVDPASRHAGRSILTAPGTVRALPADDVLLATGFTMDRSLFEMLGVTFSGDTRAPELNPDTMETNVPGVYAIGTATGGDQRGYTVFITTSHPHCLRAARAIAPDREIPDEWVGNAPDRDYPLVPEDIE